MARLLYIMPDIESVDSSSFNIASKFIIEYFRSHPQDELDVIDLHLDLVRLTDEDGFKRLAGSFMSADKYVFVTPDWNSALMARFSEYVRAVRALGNILRMLPNLPGDQIRRRNKKCMHIYSAGSGMTGKDGPEYFRLMMDYLGITELETIALEDTDLPSGHAGKSRVKAEKEAMDKAAKF